MSDELAVGQRELTAETSLDSFSADEANLVMQTVHGLLMDIVKASGSQTLTAALGELSQNAAAGLAASAKPVKEEGEKTEGTGEGEGQQSTE